jgi:hypothetical protein
MQNIDLKTISMYFDNSYYFYIIIIHSTLLQADFLILPCIILNDLERNKWADPRQNMQFPPPARGSTNRANPSSNPVVYITISQNMHLSIMEICFW